ncbi:MAG: hypothetical protein WAQ98_11550 [Blastocatellia bacterium]
MPNEDLIRRMADELARKLLKNNNPQRAFIIFGEESSELLRSKVLNLLPNEEIIENNTVKEKIAALSTAKAVVIVGPSIDLVSKITLLQTNCPSAALVVKALFDNKRVIILANGPLAEVETLRTGLRRAVEDLRCKLVEMGIEFVDLIDLAQILDNPINSITSKPKENINNQPPQPTQVQQEAIPAILNPIMAQLNQKAVSYSLPVIVYPQSSIQHLHPSQIRINPANELGEFVDFLQTKQCTMEKGKPCDSCDICNTVGF